MVCSRRGVLLTRALHPSLAMKASKRRAPVASLDAADDKLALERLASTDAISSGSAALRLGALAALRYPHLWFCRAAGHLVPVIYLLSLPGWIKVISSPPGPRVAVAVQDVVVESTGKKGQYPSKRIKQEVAVVVDEREPLRDASPLNIALGYTTIYRALNILSLLLNTLLFLSYLDINFGKDYLLKMSDLQYTRVSSMTPHSADINVRLPSHGESRIAHVAYRPQLDPALRSIESPLPWETSQPIRLSGDDDWAARVKIDNLRPGMTYEYRLLPADHLIEEESSTPVLNFTTFPEPRITDHDANHFRFIHAGTPRHTKHPYNPFAVMPPLLPLQYPYTTPTPAHFVHRWRDQHLAQPAWRVLGLWLEDMRERVAWAQVKFGLMDTEIELAGHAKRPMSSGSSSRHLHSRQLMASKDVKSVVDSLPIIPSRVQSPSGSASSLEPAALGSPEVAFNYADTQFYRLRRPLIGHAETEPADWLADVAALKTWLACVNGTDGFKFILTSTTLSPWFGGSQHETEWREAVLDILAFVPNIIVLSESSYGFSASMLRRTVIEFASPPFESPPASLWPKRFAFLPAVERARREPLVTWAKQDGEIVEVTEMETIDRLLNFVPSTGGPKWTSIEVDMYERQPRAKVTAFDQGLPVWKLDVVGTRGRGPSGSSAVGSVAEGFMSMLRRLGLVGGRWF